MRYSYVPESHVAHELGEQRMPLAPYPVPEWTSRQPCPPDWIHPTPVLKLAEFAREHEWEVEVRYARGRVPHARTGRALSLQHLISVRTGMHPRTKRQAVAIYASPVAKANWTWNRTWIWGPDLHPFGMLGVTELKEWLAAGGQLGSHWLAAVTARISERKAATVVKPRAQKSKREHGG